MQISDNTVSKLTHWKLISSGSGGGASISDFTGTNGSSTGAAGLVPQPVPGDESKYLRGDGGFESIQNFTGASGGSTGTAGLVPAPLPGDDLRFLRGDGQFASASTTLVYTVGPESYHQFTTIQLAVTAAEAAPATATVPIRIEVAAGTYAGFTVNNQYITIVGAGQEATLISGAIQINNLASMEEMLFNGAITIANGVSPTIRNCRSNNVIITGQTTAGTYLFENVDAALISIEGGQSVTVRGCAGNLQILHNGPLTAGSDFIRIEGGNFETCAVRPRLNWGTCPIQFTGTKFRRNFSWEDFNTTSTAPVLDMNSCVFGDEAGSHSFRCGTVRLKNCDFMQLFYTIDTALVSASSCTFTRTGATAAQITADQNVFDGCVFNGDVLVQQNITINPNVWFKNCVINGNYTQTHSGTAFNRYDSTTFNGIFTQSGTVGEIASFNRCVIRKDGGFSGDVLIYEGGAEIVDCTIWGSVRWRTSIYSASTILGTTIYGGVLTVNLPNPAELYLAGVTFFNNTTLIINSTANLLTIYTANNNVKFASQILFTPGPNITTSVYFTSNS